jgi:hypothetical protein
LPRAVYLPALFLTCLSGLSYSTGALTACTEPPPPPAAEYPFAAPPVRAEGEPAPASEDQCGLVKRAKQTWVGFGPGMTIEEMVPAGVAAAEVVRALDAAICGLLHRRRPLAVLQPHRSQLKAQAADCGGFEVTQVLWQDTALSHARVELRGRGGNSSAAWLASLVKHAEAWHVESFARQQH